MRGRLEVHLFGRLRLECDGRALPGPSGAKAQELLAFLLLHRGQPLRREAVADRLWGDGACSDPRKTLRQALWRLRSGRAGMPALVRSLGGDWIELDPDAPLWLDVADLETAWLGVQRTTDRELSSPAWKRAEAALRLYSDDLLEGRSWSWCLAERQRLRDIYFSLAEEVLGRYLAAGAHGLGIRLGAEILRHDPSRERTHRRLIHLYTLAGDRTAALRQYERCVEALREEFGIAPSRRTREIGEQIRAEPVSADAVGPVARPPADSQAVSSVLQGLHQLRDLLSEARREVHLEIQAIETVLHPRTRSRPAARARRRPVRRGDDRETAPQQDRVLPTRLPKKPKGGP